MQISLEWLREFVELPAVDVLCERFAAVGIEVEEVRVFDAAGISATLVLGLTPNRPDLLSHMGVAREVAAATGRRLKAAKWRVAEQGPDINTLARVLVEDPVGCKRYCARVIQGVRIGASPAWLKARLESVGQRSINNVVDVTNYVLMELGQPLHAFDLERLAVEAGCATLRVRHAQDDEKMTTLDGAERTLQSADLVIADARRVLALAGVMGGAESEVTAGTTQLFLESACFDATTVRRCSKRLGLHTESSHRFERGADPAMASKALDRCAQLILEVAGGTLAKGMLEVAQRADHKREITLRLERVGRLLGEELAAETVVELLEPLEVRCMGRNDNSMQFQAPTFRPDLTREVDLIEEVARRYGYDRFPARLPDASGEYSYEPLQRHRAALARQVLLSAGCSETVSYGFGSPATYVATQERDGVAARLLNPLGEEMSALRTSLLPGLLAVVRRNQRAGGKHLRYFEIGTTFQPRVARADHDERDRELLDETLRVAIVMQGGRDGGRWYEKGGEVDFSDLAGVLESLADAFDRAQPIARRPASAVGFNPYCAAELLLGEEEGAARMVGVAGQLHPELLQAFAVAGPVFAAELSLDALDAADRRAVTAQSLPRYPGTRRDVAIVAERGLAAEQVRRFLEQHAGGALGPEVVERVRLFDVYRGKPIPETHVSLAFAIDYRSRDRTLTDAEVGAAFDGVLEQVRRAFGVEVRA